MEKIVKNNITISGARIIFRDFSGKKNKFNNEEPFPLFLKTLLQNGCMRMVGLCAGLSPGMKMTQGRRSLQLR